MLQLTPNQVLAHNVKRFREDRDWSLSELAEKVNAIRGTRWTKQTVLQIEKYDEEERTVGRKVSMDEVVALASVFRVSVIELLLPPETIEDEDVLVDMGPVGIRDWRHLRDRSGYAAIAFHFPESEQRLSNPSLWTELGDQIEGEQARARRKLNAEIQRWAEDQIRRFEAILPSDEAIQRRIKQMEEEENGDDQED